ncbi:HET-domain-containing protein [Polychaeton citri CBS 116435]|uniref:HET-domain-containing protein n=1 Tax=Polychaeton citri CBS 116435 TaxID=1314669 RepID=A0A9P4PVY3_9PEZI|nr:HET-domain-containing protein [Polychaeton citri CBS 116435]
MYGAQALAVGAWHRFKEDTSREYRIDWAKRLERWHLRSPEAVGTPWRSSKVESRQAIKQMVRNGLWVGLEAEISRMSRRSRQTNDDSFSEDMVIQNLRRNAAAKATLFRVMEEDELREMIKEILEAKREQPRNEKAASIDRPESETPSLELSDIDDAVKANIRRATNEISLGDDYVLEHFQANHLLDFTYDPLPVVEGKHTIRLMILEPGESGDVLTCTMADTTLEESSSFESVSYCWGDEQYTHTISLNGRNFLIRYNLALALLYLRQPDTPRRLWIDALCINQLDDEERSSQVGMMSRIYGRAEQTIVWLGTYHQDSAAGFRMLRRLAEEAKNKVTKTRSLEQVDYHSLTGNYSYETMRQTGWLKRSTSEGLEADAFEDPEIDGVQGLLYQDWFARIWVIQEISLCKKATFVWFDDTLDWETMRLGLAEGLISDFFQQTVLGLLRFDVFDKYRSIASIDQLEAQPNPAIRLLHLLARFHDWEATDKRDKVYGLLGLVGDGGSDLGMVADYSLGVAETYTKAAIVILHRTKDLKILGRCIANVGGLIEGLPSWVPDWSNTAEAAMPFDEGVTGHAGTFQATDSSEASIDFREDSLSLRGYEIDKVAAVGDMLPSVTRGSFDDYHDPEGKEPLLDQYFDDPNINDPIEFIKSQGLGRFERTRLYWKLIPRTGLVIHSKMKPIADYLRTLACWSELARCYEKDQSYVSGDTNSNAFMMTLVAGCLPNGLTQTKEEYDRWIGSLAPIRRLLKHKVDKHDHVFVTLALYYYMKHTWEGYDPFNALLEHARLRCLARTEKGYLALVPPDTQVGDSLGLFEGGRWPIVFRKSNGTDEHTVVGDSYVHGIMDGSAFNSSKCKVMWFS